MHFDADTCKWETSTYTVGEAFSLLKELGLVKLHEPRYLQSSNAIMSVRVLPQGRRRIKCMYAELKDCLNSMWFMRRVNRDALKQGCENYLLGKFADKWVARNQFTESDVQGFFDYACQPPAGELDDFCTKPFPFMINFNVGFNTCQRQSSDYWKEYEANRVDVEECNYMWSFGGDFSTGRKFADLIDHISGSSSPKQKFPLYYDFLCGKKMRIVRKAEFCFVSKYLDCSAEGLRKVARHYLENCVRFEQATETVAVDYDSIKVNNIRLETRGFEDLRREICGYEDYWEFNYFTEDIDADKITRVIFEIEFRMDVQLKEIPEPSENLERYRYGLPLDNESGFETMRCARDFFEHPRELFFDRDWVILKPTLESFGVYKKRRFFSEGFTAADVAKLFFEYGSDEARSKLHALKMIRNPKNRETPAYKEFCECDSSTFMGSTDWAMETEVCICLYTYYKAAVRALLKNWKYVKTPRRLLDLIKTRVQLDPLSYTESPNPDIAAYARTLI